MIDFWFAIGSTYTYLSVMRIDELAAGVEVRWRPFDIRHVLIAHDNIPYAGKVEKSAYMWRDLQRWSDAYGLSPRFPAPYPLADSPQANRIAALAAEEGWVEPYVRATYRRWFEDGQCAGEEPNLSASIAEAGQDPARVLAEANSPDGHARLLAVTKRAMALGVFGAPTFAVGGELFWGNDRLEDAIAWAKSGGLASRG
ncbi:2-hydroxychromene-2-carboxylate isomerase [Altererythrobacter salegens]|uniref:2-hydroxychromene-2-carboxylate isomerase n=1 Tax=Croceibacterium salegens TaxID=1737568 RepID=A0A6I4SSV7_9SPHN|nr:2-hydroxychromene-2-carboxylate isomerase [Croceibacterium salegens]MXO59034.1 2-hydroxychromene-2-carboxylate isomerase [Croceibacterium salegens]